MITFHVSEAASAAGSRERRCLTGVGLGEDVAGASPVDSSGVVVGRLARPLAVVRAAHADLRPGAAHAVRVVPELDVDLKAKVCVGRQRGGLADVAGLTVSSTQSRPPDMSKPPGLRRNSRGRTQPAPIIGVGIEKLRPKSVLKAWW